MRIDSGIGMVEVAVTLSVVGVMTLAAAPVFMDQIEFAQDTATMSDARILGEAVAEYYLDGESKPVVALVDGHYTVAGQEVLLASPNVTVQSQNMVSESDWCVALGNSFSATSKVWNYSAGSGLSEGACKS